MPDGQPDRDPDSLRKRVSELEAIVQSQQQTIAKMLPGRRNVLKGAGLLTGGALAGAAATERASAQAAGTVGTSNDPVNLNAWDLNVANQVTSDLPMGGNDLTNVGAADMQTGKITNHTDIRAHLSGDYSYSTADGWDTLPLRDDANGKDTRDEWTNTSNTFSPDEDGEYWVAISASFAVSADGDDIRVRFSNSTDGINKLAKAGPTGGTAISTPSTAKKVNLLSAKTYQVEVRNDDNDDTIRDFESQTFVTIERANV